VRNALGVLHQRQRGSEGKESVSAVNETIDFFFKIWGVQLTAALYNVVRSARKEEKGTSEGVSQKGASGNIEMSTKLGLGGITRHGL
jgi:hypothetical protein